MLIVSYGKTTFSAVKQLTKQGKIPSGTLGVEGKNQVGLYPLFLYNLNSP